MIDMSPTNPVTPYVGLKFRSRSLRFDRAEEDRMMMVCGSSAALFQECIDPAAFIPHAIRESAINGITENGGVNMLQSIRMDSPLRLDEEITVSGEITEIAEAPRGLITTTDTWYHGQDGRLGMFLRRVALKTDPNKMADPSLRGAGERPAPVVADPLALEQIGSIDLTPDDVKTYSLGTGNLLHVDPASAKRAGYRAPIVGGSQGARYLTAALWREGVPKTLDIDIYFRRPIFWDESFEVRAAGPKGARSAFCLSRGPKVLTEIRVNAQR
ncbi:MaoC/PaaZ C-terminal domain-containing protein [Pseudooceanicola sp.]|uniref:MaoC/PaaZ C-terminal domain-containing protein n=1 Tax=Pseudooceanicola sp. TaxID=1914328 RepID=UPI002634691C|nr:MaoC/PaaZ C-terminal domain-containing protein [Pseudooceanicola sp.]MDF1854625.1 MaoC/PaaZ C-terminal domain-containing protein [Pseudooceanicola sp.]